MSFCGSDSGNNKKILCPDFEDVSYFCDPCIPGGKSIIGGMFLQVPMFCLRSYMQDE